MADPDRKEPEAIYVVASPFVCSQIGIATPKDADELVTSEQIRFPLLMHSFTTLLSNLSTVRSRYHNQDGKRWELHKEGCLVSMSRKAFVEFCNEHLPADEKIRLCGDEKSSKNEDVSSSAGCKPDDDAG